MKNAEIINKNLTGRTASVHNLGCKVNQYETDALGQMLKNAGATLVPFGETADICVINTCSVTNIADQKSRQMIHRARQKNPDAIIVGTGCYIQTKTDLKPGDLGCDILLGTDRKSKLVEMITELLEKRGAAAEESGSINIMDRVEDTNILHSYEELAFSTPLEHTRAFIKAEDGCNAFCSYCIIPYARGRVRSRRIADIVTEIKGLSAAGYREIVISGIHLPSFGMDTGEDLLDLIRCAHEVDGIERIRLGSLEPRVITEEFAAGLAALPKVAPHFHLSLQSGCDSVLKRMNRKYTCDEYREKCDILRRVYDKPAITTDVIVGFPGETDEEFETTRKYLEEIGFYEMHVFKFSRRHGTAADRMDGQIPDRIKTERSHILIDLADKMSKDFIESYRGTKRTVILENECEKEGIKGRSGFTPEYIRAFVPGDTCQGDMVEVTL